MVYVIGFKDPGLAKVARKNTERVNELGNNRKLVKLRFGLLVHGRTPTDDFGLNNANPDDIEKIVTEEDLAARGFRIEEVARLKKKEKVLEEFASLGIYVYSAEGTAFILNYSVLVLNRVSGSLNISYVNRVPSLYFNREAPG